MVAWAGLEPATHGFSVRCSTNWATEPDTKWRSQRDLNSRSPVWQTGMLTTTPWDLIGCGGRTWTNDLRVMSPVSYHCSTPRYKKWRRKRDSNPRGCYTLSVFKTDPFSQTWVFLRLYMWVFLVDPVGLEPTTNRLWAGSSDQLS